ncbi:unnamed protein product [Phaedon cochleariae]|uniref:52 kDa repressor of the inhibitor of the protein kinase-like n=1 Tax=Phaedon cochleariae TaxID=80249 RepID=A0A9P0DJI0_PHACE|nr:unnamed protein product [Phaedon cochleariae]
MKRNIEKNAKLTDFFKRLKKNEEDGNMGNLPEPADSDENSVTITHSACNIDSTPSTSTDSYFPTENALETFNNSNNLAIPTDNVPSSSATSATPSENSSVTVIHSAYPIDNITSVSDSETIDYYQKVFDIGVVKESSEITEFQKYKFLKESWYPPGNYQFPFSEHNKNNKIVKRYLSFKHLNTYEWVTYSHLKRGLFCKYCVIFSKPKDSKQLKGLTLEPIIKFAKLLGSQGCLENHNKNKYHIEAVLDAQNFIKSFENPQADVRNQLHKSRASQVSENRKRLKPIINSILFLGKQNIAFRGHRDDGVINVDENVSETNEGNFRELLKFRVESGDETLREHLRTSSSRATYVSKTTQNDLICCIGEEIRDAVIRRVNAAAFYCIIFDETTDVSHISQMSIVLRYVDIDMKEAREDFISFVDCHEENFSLDEDTLEPILNGKVLARTVLNVLTKLGLDLKKCIGICTDGCSVMVSKKCGAVEEIRKCIPHAVPCSCYNHALNLAVSKSSTVHSVRNLIGTVKEISSFFTASSKRHFVLKHITKTELKSVCETRWVERHDSILQFKNELPNILQALDKISLWNESESAKKARNFATALRNCEFVITLCCLANIFSITLPLSNLLQTKNLDKKQANDVVSITLLTLQDKRDDASKYYLSISNDAKQKLKEINVEFSMPRITGRMVHRPNPTVSSVDDHYRITVFIPLLDSIILDLKDRLSENKLNLYNLHLCVPSVTKNKTDEEIYQGIRQILEQFPTIFEENDEMSFQKIASEMLIWKKMWDAEQNIPDNGITALKECNKHLFPYISILLELLCCLPVSVASSERSFSTLRRLKDWIRSRMVQDRLNGLALMHIHRGICSSLNVDDIIQRYASQKNRRLEFVI